MNAAEGTIDTVKAAVTTRSVITALKENRVEVLLCIVIAHLLGVSDRIVSHASGICF